LRKLEEMIVKANVEEFNKKLSILEASIETVYHFLNKVLRLNSFEDLPSHTALVPMIYYVYLKVDRGLKVENAELLRLLSWYILASLRGIFSGSGVDSRLERALASAEKGIDSMFNLLTEISKGEAKISKEDLIKEFRGRGGGVASDAAKFLLRVLLTLNGADDWSGRLRDLSRNDLELHHIFPKGTNKHADSIANLTFVSRAINRNIRNKQPSVYIFDELKLSADTLKRHFMPTEKEYYTNFKKFINERASVIVREGRRLLPDLFK
jgi:hypothetical protein